jgi:hypothetical protein
MQRKCINLLSCSSPNPSSNRPHCKQIPTKASLPTPPLPSRSNSSIIALSSSSSKPVSPSSLATLFKSSSTIHPFPSASNRSNARSISSLGSLSRIFLAASCEKAACGIRSCDGCGCVWSREGREASWRTWDRGTPCVVRRCTSSGFGGWKPRARRATRSSW